MPGLATYDRRSVSLNVNAVPIVFEEVTFARDTDDWSDASDADGVVVRNKLSDTRGTITITVSDQQQETNALLEGIRIADVTSLTGFFTVQMRDTLGDDFAFTGFTWILKPPDMTKGAEAGTKEWTLRAANLELKNLGLPRV